MGLLYPKKTRLLVLIPLQLSSLTINVKRTVLKISKPKIEENIRWGVNLEEKLIDDRRYFKPGSTYDYTHNWNTLD